VVYNSGGIESILKSTSHCKWAPGAAFQNKSPVVVNSKIIEVHTNAMSYQLGVHITICYCPTSSHYNCSVDQLGPVFPGENLTVDLCLPYNHKETAIVYIDTNNKNLLKSACIANNHKSTKHTFHYSKSNRVHFVIASAQPEVCELFLTALPNLFTTYDVFYVNLLLVGFTLQHGICDCLEKIHWWVYDQWSNSFQYLYIGVLRQ